MTRHQLDPSPSTTVDVFSRDLPPVLTVDPGDTIVLRSLNASGHLQPQTADSSRNAFMVQAGGGVDYRVNARLSLRVEGDYVFNNFFSQHQNDFQGAAGVVFHF